jgi:hypothetical protein
MRNLPIESEGFFKSRTLLESLAGAFLIRPEGRIADQSLQFIKLALACAGVKGTSARLRRAL